jgi:mono/diheme cytochrome c family protein
MKKNVERMLAVAVTLAALAAGIAAYAWSGLYDIGADVPHWKSTYALLATLRDRSIHARAENLVVPNLDDPQLILKGAGQYAAMCTGCHLAPGMRDSEIRPGLYPQPPNLAQQRVDPKIAFWVIKHGIKMSAMPAWGSSRDDATVWSMVAFLRKLPGMTPAEYKAVVAKAPPDDDMDMDDHRDHGDSHMGDMPMPAGAATSAMPASMSEPAQ